jgi:hypothetical protein
VVFNFFWGWDYVQAKFGSAPPRSTGMEFFQGNLWMPPQSHGEKQCGTNGPIETYQFQYNYQTSD